MPPRAQRLYPRVRERPPEFQVNSAWPLWRHLRMFVTPSSPYHGMSMTTYGPLVCPVAGVNYAAPFGRWDSYLNRMVFTFGIGPYLDIPLYSCLDLNGGTVAAWCNQRSGQTERWDRILAMPGTSNGKLTFAMNVGRINAEWSNNTYRAIDVTPVSYNAWWFMASTCDLTSARLFVNGEQRTTADPGSYVTYGTTIWIGRRQDGSHYFDGSIADLMLLDIPMSTDMQRQLADPSNVDLRIGGVPLILPPRRRLWPVAPVAEYVKRRQLGLRVGCREAVL